jgi:sterol desaturase/sphingolipid hydroxylase (fatty acid hydroxylase superfamily)
MLTDFALAHEPILRIAVFFLVLAGMAIWEIRAPRRMPTVIKVKRWANNLALLLINSFLVRILFPAAAVGFAVFAETHEMGILRILEIPESVAIVASIVLLDLAIYLQHLIFHAVPLLWRLHRVHHADLDFDVTTGVRFHPIEILLSMGIKFLVIVTLGPPIWAVLIFETLLNVTAMFNHSNVAMPAWIDRILRFVLVTPDMHRVHHSIDRAETNSNFGFCFSLWDRLLGTYKEAPALGHLAMTIGVSGLRDPDKVINLKGMLAIPFGVIVRPDPLVIRSNEPI